MAPYSNIISNLGKPENLVKGELHIHLSGAISPSKIKELFSRLSVSIPLDYSLETDLYVSSNCTSLSEYLKPWKLLRLLPVSRECLNEMLDSAFSGLATANISFVELRHTLVHMAALCSISLPKALFWMLEGITKSSEKYKITAGLVLTVSRGPMATLHLQQLLDAYTALGMPRAVVGLDLAGHEDVESSEDLGHQFRDAKDRYGFGITIHAGETGSSTRVWEALEEFSADRIGHGVAAILDPALLDALRERDICLELCPTSNLLTNAEAGFPNRAVISLIQFEVPFVLCSDNPGIQNNSINNDYQLFLDATNRNDILLKMYEQQQKYTFLNNK